MREAPGSKQTTLALEHIRVPIDKHRRVAAQGALRIVTGGGSPAHRIEKQKAHVEAHVAKG